MPTTPPRSAAAQLSACLMAAALACLGAPAHAADVEKGAAIASQGIPPSVLACATCHGAKGEGGPGFPPLAGTGASYLHEQLDHFADGKRQNAIMEPIAKGLDDAQRADVAAYFASLSNGLRHEPATDIDPKDPGAWLVLRGHMEAGIPACVTCHGPGSAGVGEHFPPLARLSPAYIKEQIAAWKNGTRDPGPLALMGEIAKRLSDSDVDAITQYYARQQPQQ